MAAPTPISSLVHSSTLVTAGIYLIIRFNCIFKEIKNLLLILRILTSFLARITALRERDLKKVIAMSTLSQIRFIIISLSLGN
jgi:NADH-ubiquinone oxidoreductase chain 5